MFWKRKKEVVHSHLGPFLMDSKKVRKEFEIMKDLIVDAEHYDCIDEKQVSIDLLELLKNYIEVVQTELKKSK